MAWLPGNSTIEVQKNVFAYWNGREGAEGRYRDAGRMYAELTTAELEPGAFIRLPDMTQADAMLLLGTTAPFAGRMNYAIPERPDNEELEAALLRAALESKPRLPMTARQAELVAAARQAANKRKRKELSADGEERAHS